ncbi:MAG TPA: methyltransferase [Pirellulales bacterium]|jgi:ubiquinone/menaquinone biosynthesis C-methylase UbiE
MSQPKSKKPAKSKATASVNPKRILELTWDFCPPLMVEAALSNGVFDALDAGAKTVEETAAATGASERGLRILMNGLVATNFLARRGKKFSLAPDVAAFLIKRKPAYLGGTLHHLSRDLIPHWLRLTNIVRTGKPESAVNQEKAGSQFFANFVEEIYNRSYPAAKVAAETLIKKLAKPFKVLDIATGSGVWGIAMAERSPQVEVTAVDWPGVIPVTRKVVAEHKLNDQFSYVEGDIQSAKYGDGFHLATLGHILHSEGEANSRKLLKRVFDALAPKGTVVIAEFMPNDDRSGPPSALIFAVNMLVNTDQGDTFTFKEMKSWLTETGFRKIRTLDAPGPSPLLLADKT